MDDPPFYRDDVQAYYDLLVTATGLEEPEALRKVRDKFKLGGRPIKVTPTGEIRIKGVVDDPNPPKPRAPEPPPEGDEPPPDERDAEDERRDEPAAEESEALARWVDRGAPRVGRPPFLHLVARRYSVSEGHVAKLWGFARSLGSSHEHALASVCEALGRSARRASPSLDNAWAEWLGLDNEQSFDEWVQEAHPDFAHLVGGFTPPDRPQLLPESESALPDVYRRWRVLANVNAADRLHYATHADVRETLTRSRKVKTALIREGLGRTRTFLRLLTSNPEQWSTEDWETCREQCAVVERTRKNGAPLRREDGTPTRKLVALRAWGHDPEAVVEVSGSEALIATRPNWLCPFCYERMTPDSVREDNDANWLHECDGALPRVPSPDARLVAEFNRYLDLLPGVGPQLLAEKYDSRGHPKWDALKAGKQELDSEERQLVMDRKAVRRFNGGGPTPAVWKSLVGEKTWYVTNTHRAFNVAPTVKGAIRRYHEFIKSTA